MFKEKYEGALDTAEVMNDALPSGAYVTDYEQYRIVFDNKYQLGVYVFEGNENRAPLTYVQLAYANDNPEREEIKDMADKEKIWSIMNRTNARFKERSKTR